MEEKNARLQALIEGIIYKLAPITNVYNVYVDKNTTLAKKLSEIITSLNGKAKSEDVGDISKLTTIEKGNIVSAINEVAQKSGDTDLTGYATEQYVHEYSQPKGDYLVADKLQGAVDDALAQAKESGEFDGATGNDGTDGKSAYAYAQEAGYTGTEAEFAAKLAEEYPPPDWQAAEGEPGHILNRTHWRDVTETVLFEQTITVANNQFIDPSGVSIPLNAGETYTVVWDGVSYKTVAKDMVYNGFDAVAVGNGAFAGEGDTGEPFLILTLEGVGYGVVCLTNGEHAFAISGNEYTYHTIPPEYLAGSKPFYIDLKTDDNYGPIIYETDITKNEVKNALAKGYQIVVQRKLPRYNLYDYFLMDRQTNGEWLYFYRIFYENRPRCEILEFRYNESGGYDITHSRHEIVNPTALKNPCALTINGTSYDGSQAVDLTEAVNNMIVAKLNDMTHAEEVAF